MVGTVIKSGEPITKAIANSSILFTKQKIIDAKKLGFNIGIYTSLKTVNLDAPKSRLASIRSCGTEEKPADKIRIA